MTQMSPRYRSNIATMAFAQAAQSNPHPFYPSGGLSPDTYGDLIADVSLTFTQTGTTVEGIPTYDGVKGLLKKIELALQGSLLQEGFVSIANNDLQAFEMIERRDTRKDPRNDIALHGGDQVTVLRGIFPISFIGRDTIRKYDTLFPVSRFAPNGQVDFNITWGTPEDIVAGGTFVTKTITNCVATIRANDYSADSKYASNKNLLYKQRLFQKQQGFGANGALGVDEKYVIARQDSSARGFQIYQCTIDANGVETPTTLLIRPTDPIRLYWGSDVEIDTTWEQLIEKNRTDYGRSLPDGRVFIDFTPENDLLICQAHNLKNINEVSIVLNHDQIPNSALRISKFAYATFSAVT